MINFTPTSLRRIRKAVRTVETIWARLSAKPTRPPPSSYPRGEIDFRVGQSLSINDYQWVYELTEVVLDESNNWEDRENGLHFEATSGGGGRNRQEQVPPDQFENIECTDPPPPGYSHAAGIIIRKPVPPGMIVTGKVYPSAEPGGDSRVWFSCPNPGCAYCEATSGGGGGGGAG